MSEFAIRESASVPSLLEEAERALSLVQDVGDAELLFRKLKTIEHAARLAKSNAELRLRAGRLQLRAERRWGELLGPPEHSRTPEVVTGRNDPPAQRVSEHRARKVFEVNERIFWNYLESVRDPEALRRARLLRLQREWLIEQSVEPEAVYSIGDVEIRHCNLRDLELPAASVDLIFTDPPYPAEFLPEWEALAQLAARTLKRGRLLVAYSGQYHLPEVMYALGCELEYVWLGALVTPGAHNQVQQRHIRSAAKPLLFYSAGEYELGPWVDDAYISEKRAKTEHAWQQSVGAASYFIEKLTKPGDLIVDPFLGSGTTAMACRDLGRCFLGCDVDPTSVAVTRERLAA